MSCHSQYVANLIKSMKFILVMHVTNRLFTFQECLPLNMTMTGGAVMVLLYGTTNIFFKTMKHSFK